jgi:ferredoxin
MSLFHKTLREGSGFQRYTLYLLARYIELPFLWVSYRLFRGKWKWLGSKYWFQKIIGPLIYSPIARHGDTGSPIPYEELVRHIDAIDGIIAVGPCRCRITNDGCDHPLETDIVIRTGTGAFMKAFPKDFRIITKKEAEKIITDCHNLGMFHMLFYHCPSSAYAEYAICNCCTCGCAIYIANQGIGQRYFPLIKGDWEAVTDPKQCKGHGNCINVCPFNARILSNGKVITHDCTGCGLCVDVCPEKAIRIEHSHHKEDK